MADHKAKTQERISPGTKSTQIVFDHSRPMAKGSKPRRRQTKSRAVEYLQSEATKETREAGWTFRGLGSSPERTTGLYRQLPRAGISNAVAHFHLSDASSRHGIHRHRMADRVIRSLLEHIRAGTYRAFWLETKMAWLIKRTKYCSLSPHTNPAEMETIFEQSEAHSGIWKRHLIGTKQMAATEL